MNSPAQNKLPFTHLSTRELQAYGAACLARFCADKGIDSPHVCDLVGHLVDVLTTDNLPAWESAGARLALAGRGDPLPSELREAIGDEISDEFERLVSLVVEIGLVDMYGASTDEPLEMLTRALDLLQRCGVRAPPTSEVFAGGSMKNVRGWGPAVTHSQSEHVRTWLRNALGTSR